jgi:hypothetical protein
VRWLKGLLQTALGLAALLLTVGASTAISNGRSWIDLVGSSGMFGFLASPQVRVYIAALVFFALGYIAKDRIRDWKAKQPAQATNPHPRPYELYSRMDMLIDRIQAYFQATGLGPAENRVSLSTDCFSFNTTLLKAGYAVPDVRKLDDDSRLKVLGFYYSQVGPYLRDGHVDEAKQIAASLSAPEAMPSVGGSQN